MGVTAKKQKPKAKPASAMEAEGDTVVSAATATFDTVRAGDLVPWPGLNPRTHFDPEKQAQLIASIGKHGVHEPLLVDETSIDGKRRIVAGERRWRAAMAIGADTMVPVMVRAYTETEAAEIALIENLDRDDLTEIEEARGFRRLIELGLKQGKIAERIGRSQEYISNRLRLLTLPDLALQLLEDGVISVGIARDCLLPFAKIPEPTRGKLFAGAAKKIREASKEPRFDHHSVESIMGDLAAKVSRSLDRHTWPESDRPQFPIELHDKQCDCGGPKVKSGYSSRARRCFNVAWWDKEQAKAIAAEKAKKNKAIAKVVEKADQVNGRPVLDGETFRKKFGFKQYELLARGSRPEIATAHDTWRTRHEILDVTQLPAESLLFVEGYDYHNGTRALVCTDEKAVAAAKAAVEKERKAMLAERQADRARREADEAARSSIEPWMLRQLLRSRPDTSSLQEIGRDHGIDLGKHGMVYEKLGQMGDTQLVALFKVAAIRCRELGTRYGEDPIDVQVDKELVEKYLPLYRALLPPAPVRDGLTPDESKELTALLDDLAEKVAEAEETGDGHSGDFALAIRAISGFVVRTQYDPTDEERSLLERARKLLFEMREQEYEEERDQGDATCIGCGCTDAQACLTGCAWLATDRDESRGVCSSCADSVDDARDMLDAELAEIAAA